VSRGAVVELGGAPMDEDGALAEAKRRFGPWAFVAYNSRDWEAPFRVGVVTSAAGGGARRVIVGRGKSWERAFFSSEKRGRRGRVTRGRPGVTPLPSLFT